MTPSFDNLRRPDYFGTPMEDMDPFQRQLYRLGIGPRSNVYVCLSKYKRRKCRMGKRG